MKKNYFVIVLAFCSGLISVAQPVLTSSDITNYAATLYNVPEFSGTTITSPGPDQNWNYSSLIPSTELSPAFYLTTVPISSAPFYTTFPTANYCQKFFYTFDDVLYESYTYSNLSPTGLESFGSSDLVSITNEYIDNPFTPLPLNYEETYIDTYQSTTDSSPTTSTSTYDAYGTLITYYGTYSDVIRLKQVRENYTTYSFLKVNPYSPLLSIEVENANGNVSDVRVYDISGLSTNQNISNATVVVFPNPTNSVLNLKSANNIIIDKIIITDLTGKIIKDQTANTNAVNVEDLSNGIYILAAFSGDDKFESKFVKQ